MRTLTEEIARIKSEVAEIASKAFTGKDIQQRVNEMRSSITPKEYDTGELVWSALYAERRALQEQLYINERKIKAVENILGLPIDNNPKV